MLAGLRTGLIALSKFFEEIRNVPFTPATTGQRAGPSGDGLDIHALLIQALYIAALSATAMTHDFVGGQNRLDFHASSVVVFRYPLYLLHLPQRAIGYVWRAWCRRLPVDSISAAVDRRPCSALLSNPLGKRAWSLWLQNGLQSYFSGGWVRRLVLRHNPKPTPIGSYSRPTSRSHQPLRR